MTGWERTKNVDGGETAVWSIQFEGPDGPEWTELYLEVEPSEFFDEDLPEPQDDGWKWSVSVSECTFEQGFSSSSEDAKRECEQQARSLADPVREP